MLFLDGLHVVIDFIAPIIDEALDYGHNRIKDLCILSDNFSL